jgi:hypothetical protein
MTGDLQLGYNLVAFDPVPDEEFAEVMREFALERIARAEEVARVAVLDAQAAQTELRLAKHEIQDLQLRVAAAEKK